MQHVPTGSENRTLVLVAREGSTSHGNMVEKPQSSVGLKVKLGRAECGREKWFSDHDFHHLPENRWKSSYLEQAVPHSHHRFVIPSC